MRKSRKNKFIKKRGGKGSLSRDNDDNLKTKDSSSESTLGYGSNNNETTPEAELNDPKKLPKRITKDTPKGGLEESSEEDSEGDSSSPENAEAKKRVVVAEAVSSISA